jgi:serine/threonine protein kinase
MKYLAIDNNIIHRDLAARNLLVGPTDNQDCVSIKIADFGLSRAVEQGSYYRSDTKTLPFKWCAPEVIEFGTFSTKSDVWAVKFLFRVHSDDTFDSLECVSGRYLALERFLTNCLITKKLQKKC